MIEKDANRYGIANCADFEQVRIDAMDIETEAQLSPSGIRAFRRAARRQYALAAVAISRY
ncbi:MULTISPECIES: hypothetical protein [unclassified Sphingomonas]|nr:MULTISPECIES: hypothetical protein [unclassified Sphingomonas]